MENSTVLLIEEWEKIENQEAYLEWRTETGMVEAMSEFLDGELIIKKYFPKKDV
jgi:quinol monooxygenase YgiN